MKLEFSQRGFFEKNVQISILMKIRPAGAELFHADRRNGQIWRSWQLLFAIFADVPKHSFPPWQ